MANDFSPGAHWRDSARSARFFMVDARAAFPIFFFYICHIMVTEKLKQVVFKQLYDKLAKVEIIPYKDSIWLIDREKEHWYFEFETSGRLWWRYYFFNSFQIFRRYEHNFRPHWFYRINKSFWRVTF